MGFLQGLLGNLSEVSSDQLQEEYGAYLMDGETVVIGFKLVRDTVIFTDKRILDFDKQGATGHKVRVKSIYLDSVIAVSAETAGFGLDDSELTISYIDSPYFRANGGVSVAEKTFEFPKKFNIGALYKWLQEEAYRNHSALNQ